MIDQDNMPRVDSELSDASSVESGSVSVGKRLRSPQTIISFVIAIVIIVFVFRNLDLNFGDIWSNLATARPEYLALAFLAYYGSFPLRAMRWGRLLRNAGITRQLGYAVPGPRGLTEIYVLGWFANCLAPAKLGDAYRGYLLKKHAKPSFARTIGTIFAERFVDIVALVTLMVISVALVFGSSMPSSVRWPLIGGVALVACGVAGLSSLLWMDQGVRRLVPDRLGPYFERFEQGVTSSFARTGLMGIASITLMVWLLEGVRVYFVVAAFGISIRPWEALFVALLASLLTIIPLTPAGLGVVESGTIISLKLLDIGATDAATIALIDRGIAYWSVVAIGSIVYLVSKYR